MCMVEYLKRRFCRVVEGVGMGREVSRGGRENVV